MATFADVVKKQRKEGSSRTGAIASAIGQKTLESIDPRQFFNQSGVLTALFPSLKAYQAKGSSDKPEKGLDKLASLQVSGDAATKITLEEMVVKLNDVTIYTRLSAKNSTVLPQMARDMNLTKQNIGKLVNAQGISQATKAEMFFKRAGERESAVEAARKRGERTTPTKVEESKESKGFLSALLMGLSGLLSPFKSLFDGLKGLSDAIGSAMKLLLSGISTFSGLVTSLISNIFKGAFGLLANPAALAAAGLAGLAYLIYKLIKSDIDATKEDKPLPPPDTPEQIGERPKPTGKGLAQLKDEHDRQQKALEIGRAADPTGSYDTLEANRAKRTLESQSTSPTREDTVKETGSPQEALQFFKSKGWSDEQAAGIVGNLQAESNLKTDAVGDNGKAYGIAQWHPPRQKVFQEVYGKPIQNSNFKEQLEYVNWELNNSEARAGKMLRTAQSAPDAAEIVDKFYERSSGIHREKRMKNALALVSPKEPTSGIMVASASKQALEGKMALTMAPTTQPTIIQDNSTKVQNAGGSVSASPLSAWDNFMLESIVSRMA